MSQKVLAAALFLLAASMVPLQASPAAGANSAIPVAVADFDYQDTSGEAKDQRAQHQERVQAFGRLLRQRLAAHGHYQIRRLDCPKSPCNVGEMKPDALIAAARHAGARLLVYGGIHKMSTLVQWGDV